MVVNSVDQTELKIGQRIRLKMPAPSPDVEAAKLPPDLDRPRGKDERVEWFLASIYCSCGVAGDVGGASVKLDDSRPAGGDCRLTGWAATFRAEPGEGVRG